MVQIEYLPIVITGIGLTASILYYTNVLRNANKTREAQLYNNLYNQSINNPQFMEDIFYFFSLKWSNAEEFFELFPYGDPNSKNVMTIWRVGNFFEGIVPIVKEGLLDIRYLDGPIGFMLFDFWRRFEPIVDDIHRVWEPGLFKGTQYLVEELRKYQQANPNR